MAKKRNISSTKFVLLGFFVGLLITILGWLISLWLGQYRLSWYNILVIHRQTPGFFLIDLAPFILAYAFMWFYRQTENMRKRLETTVREMEEVIRRNLEIAKKISEGNLDFEIELKPGDELGQALLLMRDNLRLHIKGKQS